jgi:hypothetical protein
MAQVQICWQSLFCALQFHQQNYAQTLPVNTTRKYDQLTLNAQLSSEKNQKNLLLQNLLVEIDPKAQGRATIFVRGP